MTNSKLEHKTGLEMLIDSCCGCLNSCLRAVLMPVASCISVEQVKDNASAAVQVRATCPVMG